MERAGLAAAGKKALVLGSGGTSATVRAALADMGAREIVTVSRRGPVRYGDLAAHADAQLIVNTTPVGMYPDTGISPVDLSVFPGLQGVMDVIYNPLRTALLLSAQDQMGIRDRYGPRPARGAGLCARRRLRAGPRPHQRLPRAHAQSHVGRRRDYPQRQEPAQRHRPPSPYDRQPVEPPSAKPAPHRGAQYGNDWYRRTAGRVCAQAERRRTLQGGRRQ